MSNRSYTNFSRSDELVRKAMVVGLGKLGDDVKSRAIILAPKLTGALRQSAKVDVKSNGATVEVSFNTPYAKRRHYENRLHPATRLYLSQSLKSITNIGNYFKRSF